MLTSIFTYCKSSSETHHCGKVKCTYAICTVCNSLEGWQTSAPPGYIFRVTKTCMPRPISYRGNYRIQHVKIILSLFKLSRESGKSDLSLKRLYAYNTSALLPVLLKFLAVPSMSALRKWVGSSFALNKYCPRS